MCYILIAESPHVSDEKQITNETENQLVKELVEYMHTTVPYTIKQVLPAGLKSLYVGRGNNTDNIAPNPFQVDFQSIPNETKGGCYLTNRITYNWYEIYFNFYIKQIFHSISIKF